MLNHGSSSENSRQKIFLEFTRDEFIDKEETDEFEKAKNRKRSIMVSNSKLLDSKMEKAGNYEINQPTGATDKYFECD